MILKFHPLESGPLNNFLCMESFTRFYMYQKVYLKTDSSLMLAMIQLCNYCHFYSCTWMTKLVLILIMVTILKRSARLFL